MKVFALMIPVLLSAAAGCSSSSSDGGRNPQAERPPVEPEPEPVLLDAADEGFYTPPDPLPPGEHGDLVRYQPIDEPPEGVTWYRVMYLSESVAGDPTVVTGVVAAPSGEPPDGGWRLLTHAHGSTGLDDPCSPSVSLAGDGTWALETALLSGLAANRGYVVASTDYEGLGGPGTHPFLVGESEGRSVLDAALAAQQIPGLEVGEQMAIAGYSQGGHAALWAHQLAADWTPSLDIVGTMAGAPASELATSTDSLPPELRQIEVALVTGLAAAHTDDPAVDPSRILTPAGLDVRDRLGDECPPIGGVDPATPLLQSTLSRTEPWSTLLRDNTPGQVAAPAPVLIVHSAEDANVPIADSAVLVDRMCRVSQVVERRVLPTGDHVAAAVPAYQQGMDWFDDLWAGGAPASSCP